MINRCYINRANCAYRYCSKSIHICTIYTIKLCTPKSVSFFYKNTHFFIAFKSFFSLEFHRKSKGMLHHGRPWRHNSSHKRKRPEQ